MSYRVHVVDVAPDVLYVIDASLRLLSMSLLFSFYCPDSLVLTPSIASGRLDPAHSLLLLLYPDHRRASTLLSETPHP
jgi:hypothetical protein